MEEDKEADEDIEDNDDADEGEDGKIKKGAEDLEEDNTGKEGDPNDSKGWKLYNKEHEAILKDRQSTWPPRNVVLSDAIAAEVFKVGIPVGTRNER